MRPSKTIFQDEPLIMKVDCLVKFTLTTTKITETLLIEPDLLKIFS